MRYRAERDCVDFGGRFFKEGTEVDLPEGKHSAYLTPLDPEPTPAVEAAPVDEAPKKASRKKAATTKAEG